MRESKRQTKQTKPTKPKANPDPQLPREIVPKSGEVVLNRCNIFKNCPHFCYVIFFSLIYFLGLVFFWRIEHSLMKVPYNMILKGSDCLPPPPLALIPVRECPPIPTRLAK